MQYSPKLKKVIRQINQILVENQIAGIVVLHTPGFSEFVTQIQPPYSCIKHEGDNIRFLCKAADFGGDKAKRNEQIANTANMLKLLSETMSFLTLKMIELSETFDDATQSEHSETVITNSKDLEN